MKCLKPTACFGLSAVEVGVIFILIVRVKKLISERLFKLPMIVQQ